MFVLLWVHDVIGRLAYNSQRYNSLSCLFHFCFSVFLFIFPSIFYLYSFLSCLNLDSSFLNKIWIFTLFIRSLSEVRKVSGENHISINLCEFFSFKKLCLLWVSADDIKYVCMIFFFYWKEQQKKLAKMLEPFVMCFFRGNYLTHLPGRVFR